MVTADEILAALLGRASSSPPSRTPRAAPRRPRRWLVDGGPAGSGVIASVTRPFCGACDRIRLTADGQVRNCLFAATETDLRGAAALRRDRRGARRAGARGRVGKLPGHGIDDPAFLQPDRPMSAIGG